VITAINTITVTAVNSSNNGGRGCLPACLLELLRGLQFRLVSQKNSFGIAGAGLSIGRMPLLLLNHKHQSSEGDYMTE